MVGDQLRPNHMREDRQNDVNEVGKVEEDLEEDLRMVEEDLEDDSRKVEEDLVEEDLQILQADPQEDLEEDLQTMQEQEQILQTGHQKDQEENLRGEGRQIATNGVERSLSPQTEIERNRNLATK